MEKEAIEEFYEEYRLKYVGKLESWQEVIDIYMQNKSCKKLRKKDKIRRGKKQQKERTTMLKVTASQRELSVAGVETEIKQTM